MRVVRPPRHVVVARTHPCGFRFTTTGRPCENRVPLGAPWCRAGHPCATPCVEDVVLAVALDRSGVHPGTAIGPAVGRRGSARRATDLVRQAMASDDAERLGLCATRLLEDPGAALTLLGDPAASPTARQAVVQHFGRVGALIVLGYEERWRRAEAAAADTDAGEAPGGGAEAGPPSAPGALDGDPEGRYLELLVRDFHRLDARGLYEALGRIDRAGGGPDDGAARAHRWLHATYAVAGRDGTLRAHHGYMRALDDVMRLVRPLVAS
jgi:hypothetical protein